MNGWVRFVPIPLIAVLLFVPPSGAQQPPEGQSTSSNTSSSARHVRKPAPVAEARLEAGSVSNGVYRNPAFGVTYKIPPGWVLRTAEMNAREGDSTAKRDFEADARPDGGCPHTGCVLLAAFSRPPDARGEDVNASILIAAESAATYPGLRDAVQYFGPVSEIAQARGFEAADDPYQLVVGSKTLVRGDFQKDVGTRVMRQSTLVILARGYVVSFTFIGGTQDEVEELVAGLSLAGATKPGH